MASPTYQLIIPLKYIPLPLPLLSFPPSPFSSPFPSFLTSRTRRNNL